MPFIDCHSHLLSLANYPSSIYFSRYDLPETVVEALIDALGECKPIEELAEAIGELKGYHIHEFLKIIEMDLKTMGDMLDKQLGADNQAIIHMLDLEPSCGHIPQMPLELQMALFSNVGRKGNIIPFINIDPSRSDFQHLVSYALESLDFKGVKLYPPLGYNPNPDLNVNKTIKKNLAWLYDYCNNFGFPITTHCSKGGIRGKSVSEHNDLADPKYWYEILLNYPNLKVNFAHYGAGQFLDYWLHGTKNWASTIHGYMQDFSETVFSDVAFHSQAMNNTSQYFLALENALSEDAFGNILFGTDWPLHVIDYSYDSVVKKYKENMNPDWWEYIAMTKPQEFLC